MNCPYCAEPINKSDVKCRHCGEFLDEDQAPPSSSSGAAVGVIIAGVLFGVCAIVAIIAAIAIPNLIDARKHGNEAAAIGALKTISISQSLFREADKEQDGMLDYGTLTELGNSRLVDMVLASGTKQGYLFDTWPSAQTSEFLWFATASPAFPADTGDRYFCMNHEWVIYYSMEGGLQRSDIGPDCAIPSGWSPVGK